jgi:hypothetical protein
MRKEMWEPLASRMGERWHVVEAKVSFTAAVHQQRSLIYYSAWKRVSKLCRRWPALLKEGTRVLPGTPLTIKVFRTITATPL